MVSSVPCHVYPICLCLNIILCYFPPLFLLIERLILKLLLAMWKIPATSALLAILLLRVIFIQLNQQMWVAKMMIMIWDFNKIKC